jgi:hypothetical protein
MAYLTKEERDKLENELKQLNFRQAHGKVRFMDKQGRLAYYRNAQGPHKWMTRHVLTSLGTQVTLVESNRYRQISDKENRVHNDYDLIDVIVEATPDNRL